MRNELKAEIFIGLLRIRIPESQRLVMLKKNGRSSYYFKSIQKLLHVGDDGNQNGGEMPVKRNLFNKGFILYSKSYKVGNGSNFKTMIYGKFF